MRDAKKHSPEKQIQSKIHVKTIELSDVEKEAIRLKIKVMKIQRALNRPLLNQLKADQARRPIRDTFQKLKLPEEKKLKRDLVKAMKELEEFEQNHEVEMRELDERMVNR